MRTFFLDLSLQICKAFLSGVSLGVEFLQYRKGIAGKLSSGRLGGAIKSEDWFYRLSSSSVPSSPIVTACSQNILVSLRIF